MTATQDRLRKAVAYAENRLEINSVWERLSEKLNEHAKVQSALAHEKSKRRLAEEALAFRVMELQVDVRANEPELSIAALERRVKELSHEDETCQELRDTLSTTHSRIDALEAEVATLSTFAKGYSARLNSLGGYLQYLAVAGTPSNEAE